MDTKEFERHEIVGLTCKVIDAENKNLIGLQGKIIDETRNTIIIQTKDKTKVLLKEQVTLEFTNNDQKITINGKKLLKRPEERIKDETKSKRNRN